MLALIVNPVAGVGGPAGLAGSDGVDVQADAAVRGGLSRADARATDALRLVAAARPGTPVLTAAGAMGEDAARRAGLEPHVVYTAVSAATTPSDTTAAVRSAIAAGASLVLFAGGDGTARDVAAAFGDGVPAGGAAALGIPSGVKMYSPVFAISPSAAGGMAVAWLDGPLPVQEQEVLDIDEAQLRRAHVEPRLFGMLPVPQRAGRTQVRKAPTPAGEHAAVVAAAHAAASLFRPGVRYLLGPGGTMGELGRRLGLATTALGVDVVLDGRLVRARASESELLDEIARGPAKAVVTVIGGQGFVLGRGNQQLSAAVIRALGPDPLIVVAPEQKLVDLHGRPLLVDTGDADVDASLTGYVRVVTGPGTASLYPVVAPEAAASTPHDNHEEGALHAT
ncbi:ATP-NAD kinase family protein [Microbacterium horticulturae]|uniref:ATP-NAD kinase family protein n=1 Tax=Microbacterium horticulturae TaxID=3028316 RepID=A0ABY8BVD4_9MICO|nr:ATP-NAD kinase family protein [Microbacterium sp. KACC 23027]WEG08139.1 ATP-NAD kinase family protein [Microbacterium sp. KACC 23027]